MSTAGGSAEARPDTSAEVSVLLSTLPTRAWREEALSRAAEIQALSDWIDKLGEARGETDPQADKRLADAIKDHVAAVHKAASGIRPLMHTSARLARATSNIHAAETNLLRRAPWRFLRGELPNLDAHVRRHLPVDDPRRVRMEDIAREDHAKTGEGDLDKRDRESVIAAMRAASSAAAREQQR